MKTWRYISKTAFFLLFLLAPLLDIFRFDLTLGHFILFGQPWTLSLDGILHGGDSVEAAKQIFWRMIVPLIAFILITGTIIYHYGRIYCGWLCPHFSVVELINRLMLKWLGRITLWEKPINPVHRLLPKALLFLVAVTMALVWALGLLSYLLPPKPLLINFMQGNLTFGSTLFISVATVVFTLDFVFARHLFCKYGCALGLFQSLIWMANKQAMVIRFDRERAKICRTCSQYQLQKACDAACPMRLPTRNMKRAKFTCTQCGECIQACAKIQQPFQREPLLQWVKGPLALSVDRRAESRGRVPDKSLDINIVELD